MVSEAGSAWSWAAAEIFSVLLCCAFSHGDVLAFSLIALVSLHLMQRHCSGIGLHEQRQARGSGHPRSRSRPSRCGPIANLGPKDRSALQQSISQSWQASIFVRHQRMSGFPDRGFDPLGSSRNFQGTSGLLLKSKVREVLGKSPENFSGSSGKFWEA